MNRRTNILRALTTRPETRVAPASRRWSFRVSECALIAAAIAVCIAAPAAQAHRLDADYTTTPQGFRIEFFFADGNPARELTVTAQADSAEPIAIGTTDDEGAILFRPTSIADWTIVGSGAGHSNGRNPLVIPASAVRSFLPASSSKIGTSAASAPATAASQGSATTKTATSAGPHPPDSGKKRRGATPFPEIIASLAFIAVLTAVTLWMMRRSARYSTTHSHGQLEHEVAHLRQAVAALKAEIEELKNRR